MAEYDEFIRKALEPDGKYLEKLRSNTADALKEVGITHPDAAHAVKSVLDRLDASHIQHIRTFRHHTHDGPN